MTTNSKLTVVVNLRHESYDVYGGRPSVYGNPFKIGPGCTREQSIEQYRVYFNRRIRMDRLFWLAILKLRGLRIGCYCKPLPCHCDIIAEYLNGLIAE